jgi:hypothetical protein
MFELADSRKDPPEKLFDFFFSKYLASSPSQQSRVAHSRQKVKNRM